MPTPLLSGQEVSNFIGVQKLHVLVTFGNTSVAKVQTRSVQSFTRTAPGTYTVTLQRAYRTLVGIRGSWVRPSGATLQADVTADNVAVDGTLVLTTRVSSGAATDPSNGDKLMLEILVSCEPFNDTQVFP
ncbi:MAG: hypothetical protein C4340_03230 [Armatimonadota bacterium]